MVYNPMCIGPESYWCLVGNGGMIHIITINTHPIAPFATKHHEVPSGELTFCHGKSPFLMGKSTISMAIFNCYVSSPDSNWSYLELYWVHTRQRAHLPAVVFDYFQNSAGHGQSGPDVCWCLAEFLLGMGPFAFCIWFRKWCMIICIK